MNDTAPPRPIELITEDWLKANGFKWHEFERQGAKHWLLWLGHALEGAFTTHEDLGIEVSPGVPGRASEWFCWLRGDCAGRYHRFIHVRHITETRELVALIEALTGQAFDPALCRYGSMQTPKRAAWLREQDARLDRRLMREGHPWHDVERDDTIGGGNADHLRAYEDGRKKT